MVKYSEKLFLHLYNGLVKAGGKPDVCVVGSDIIAQQVLNTLHKQGLSMRVIADNEISVKSLWLGSHDDYAKFKSNGQN